MRTRSGFIFRNAWNAAAQVLDGWLGTGWGRPTMIHIEPTMRCGCRCKMCTIHSNPGIRSEDELPLERWIQIIDDIHEWSPGGTDVFIGGGEPFAWPPIYELLRHMRDRGVRARMVTSGVSLGPEALQLLAKAPPYRLCFSMDSRHSEIHDEIRGAACFERCVEAIRYIRASRPDVRLGLCTILCRQNVEDVEGMVTLAIELGVESIYFRPLLGRTHSLRSNLGTCLIDDMCIRERDKVAAAVEKLLSMKRSGAPIENTLYQLRRLGPISMNPETEPMRKRCALRWNTILIRSNGDMHPCGHITLPRLGNVRELDPSSVLRREGAKATLREMRGECTCLGRDYVEKPWWYRLRLAAQALTER